MNDHAGGARPSRRLTFMGAGVLKQVAPVLSRLGARRVFFVTGRRSFSDCGAERALAGACRGRTWHRFSDFSVNPELEGLKRGIRVFRDFAPDVMIAVGGGSVMDMAKMIGFFGTNNFAPEDWPMPPLAVPAAPPPLLAIPTTPGSGAEVTPFAVLFVAGIKRSVEHPKLRPYASFTDPDLLTTIPRQLTACSGIDALAQAMESFWSVRATPRSQTIARAAMECMVGHLLPAFRTSARASLAVLARGAHLAGKAISLTRTTACHAISYPLTSRFGVSHGHAVALTLPSMLAFNHGAMREDVVDPRGHENVRRTTAEICGVFGASSVADGCRRLEGLIEELGLARKLTALGVRGAADRERIIAEAFNPERMKNNPRRVTAQSLRAMLEELA